MIDPIHAMGHSGRLLPRDRLRIVVCRMDRALRLEASRCRRTLTGSGSHRSRGLDGIRGGRTDQALEKFVQELSGREDLAGAGGRIATDIHK